MQVDFAAKELTVKLVYYGPALSGKTTNLRAIHWLGTSSVCGELMTLETKNDRTLFFDMLPITMDHACGLNLRLKLFAVPGQVMHEATRRLVLRAADGVAFIASSRRNEASANRESFLSLKRNLEKNGMDPARIPIVIQFNKRDLDDIRSEEELEAIARKRQEPIYTAVANRGLGVIQTLTGLLRETWHKLEEEHQLEQKFGIDPLRFVHEVEDKLDDPVRSAER
jgi:signal recognition particle receptor subunit beta